MDVRKQSGCDVDTRWLVVK